MVHSEQLVTEERAPTAEAGRNLQVRDRHGSPKKKGRLDLVVYWDRETVLLTPGYERNSVPGLVQGERWLHRDG